MPARLGAEYVADNSRRTPIMLHRAIVASLERFIGILIENYAGALPLWLAPRQIAVACITSDQAEYAESVVNRLKAQVSGPKADLRADKISYKIRELNLQKLPTSLWWVAKRRNKAQSRYAGAAIRTWRDARREVHRTGRFPRTNPGCTRPFNAGVVT